MPRPSKGARLWLEPEERDGNGRVVRRASWVIRDGAHKIRTGSSREDRAGAERKLAEHIAAKYEVPRQRNRRADQNLVLDALNLYLADLNQAKGPKSARPQETTQRVLRLADFWEAYTLADVNGARCREYVKWRKGKPWKSAKPDVTGNEPRLVTEAAARRELEDLRAAINHHRREGLCSEIVSVVLPDKPVPREDWLRRSQAARLLWAARRARQVMGDKRTRRAVGDHIARFILIGLYTGTRSGAICAAAPMPALGRGYVDLERGVFYRRPPGVRETKKRQTPVRLPDRLLAHMRRWHRLDMSKLAAEGTANKRIPSFVEWNGKPVRSIRKGFSAAVNAAGLEGRVTPHTLRHTGVTWAMQNGGDLWQIAGFFGMTVETLERVYGHHHPDYQRDAGMAVSQSPGQLRDRNTVNKTR